jgi:hypothetical protein
MSKLLVCALVLALLVFSRSALAQTSRSCDSLVQLTLSNAKVTSAQEVPAGTFTPPPPLSPRPGTQPSEAFYKSLPSFCRVQITATPSSDSNIKIEVWLPAAHWNGRLQGQGNGGFAGEIDYFLLGQSLAHGYSTVATDTGHSGVVVDASWALGHPEKIADFAHRAIHEMTVDAKAAAKAYYGNPVQHSYFAGCSNGGRQALMEAQHYPTDYNGILAGAPANYWTHLLTDAIWNAQATTLDPNSYFSPAKLPALAHAVNEACDAKDGVTDGILNDPRQCHFDPSTLLCKGAESDSCFSAPQVTAVKKLYQGATDSHGHQIFPGYLPGAEEGRGGWGLWITGPEPGGSLQFAFGKGYFANMVYDNPNWDFGTAKIDQAVADADKKSAGVLNATDANLKPFASHGGKLILYHGWNDAGIPALNTINYYSSVVNTVGRQQTSTFVRLYMEPGVQHCAGGTGPDAFGEPGLPAPPDPHGNASLALEQWVEKGTAPNDIIAAKYEDMDPRKPPKMTRPLCPYPETAKYKGAGSPNDASNFTCSLPTN